ncbi:class I SAM-dependent methyltransferase [Mumia sp. zg.B17]|uniref:class I SAM-dependent methyltransferase n=1 Tax=unclassified Mumia TaxID=2621872 RepID=UPI001C6F3CF4|nr:MULTISPECIES: class I SAM-dependent methyltransferase [unclassified Mumia]MBW9204976.1 class I SAM-dependent methyltransferase [Mumia sp. zg.B17]MBW9209019.1 class I SAM-dependent methyltransferase [Mumia sp. zg.B21]
MSFDVAAESYQRFMGRFSEPLAAALVLATDPQRGWKVLDVGCGPGALTGDLAAWIGDEAVSAVDPSPAFVGAVHRRLPHVDARLGRAEDLPFADATFDASYAQLVVHFMHDPVAGLREMRRVTAPGGPVTACVWDHEGGTGPLAAFWDAVLDVDPDAPDESGLAGTREGHLEELFAEAGLHDLEASALTVTVRFESFEQWWEPFLLGVGPAGAYVAGLDEDALAAVRKSCRARVPARPFFVDATAWCVTGRV